MHETPGDIAAIDSLLARSFTAAGPHLLDIARPERRLDGRAVSERLTGVAYWRIDADRMFTFFAPELAAR